MKGKGVVVVAASLLAGANPAYAQLQITGQDTDLMGYYYQNTWVYEGGAWGAQVGPTDTYQYNVPTVGVSTTQGWLQDPFDAQTIVAQSLTTSSTGFLWQSQQTAIADLTDTSGYPSDGAYSWIMSELDFTITQPSQLFVTFAGAASSMATGDIQMTLNGNDPIIDDSFGNETWSQDFALAPGQYSIDTFLYADFYYDYNPSFSNGYTQSNVGISTSFQLLATPEPAPFAVVGLGALAFLRRRR